MAYITKDEVKEKTVKIKAIAKKYGCKVSVRGSNSSTITVSFIEGKIDFWQNVIDTVETKQLANIESVKEDVQWGRDHGTMKINHYYLDARFSGEVLQMLKEIKDVLHEGHYDHSDPMTDYFNCAWYIEMRVGSRWDKPYKLVK